MTTTYLGETNEIDLKNHTRWKLMALLKSGRGFMGSRIYETEKQAEKMIPIYLASRCAGFYNEETGDRVKRSDVVTLIAMPV